MPENPSILNNLENPAIKILQNLDAKKSSRIDENPTIVIKTCIEIELYTNLSVPNFLQ